MDTHFAVLPLDVIDIVTSQLEDQSSQILRSARFLRLPHPRTGIASLFLPHQASIIGDGKQTSKILEVQAVAPPNSRSWFMGDEVVSDGKLLVMTPVDPLFLLIPILQAIKPRDNETAQFRPAEDIIDEAASQIAEASNITALHDASTIIKAEDIMSFAALDCTKDAMRRICEVKEITTEITVFRYSSDKLIQHLRKKVAALSTPRIAEMSRSLIRSLAKDALMDDKNEDLLELGRTKLACDLLAQYLPPDIQEELLASYDFAKLDAHLKALQEEQLTLPPDNGAATKKSKNGSMKMSEDSKKRKKDTKASHGVEKLKKVNVGGMSKLSSFFTKKTT
ncbi:hypothetical protein HYDPIDRAFT_107506 [Hydnomerulius pinastri MD-312]|nr:hypothetical protein HYDPIDRAFT_107506 [Hydnomerulius pinastri MD-312]